MNEIDHFFIFLNGAYPEPYGADLPD